MTAAHPFSGSVEPIGALGWFLFAAALAALYLGINLIYPGLAPTGIPTALTRLSIHVVTLYGLWLGLARMEIGPGARAAAWGVVALVDTGWLALIWTLAVHGGFVPVPPPARALPALPLAVFLPVLIASWPLMRSRAVGAFLDAIPAPWLIALQLYRIFGGIFLVAWANGGLDGRFALPAGIGDVTTGLMALPVAYWVARGRRGPGIAWNVFGLLDFAIAVGMGIVSTPGPLQLIVPHPASTLGLYPTVMIPAFAVPSSILFHILSLRQLRRLQPRPSSRSSQ